MNNEVKKKQNHKITRSMDGFVVHVPRRKLSDSEIKNQTKVKKVLKKQEKNKPQTPKALFQDRSKLVANRNQENAKSFKYKKVLKRSALLLGLIIILAVGFVGFKALRSIDKVFHGNIISDTQALFSSTPLNGEDQGRVNILLAGDSIDDPGHQGSNLTDSIVVLSIDTKGNNTFLLSIPRDLWVNIPGYGYQKINAANSITSNYPSGYPQNGMGVLEYIITKDLGIPIDYYALANYSAFRDAVNDVGGVTVNIQSDNPKGLYDPYADLKLSNGQVTLNGQQALNLARARGDGPGAYGFPNADFDRTSHQRLLFTAIAKKALSLGVLSNPVKISNLFNSFSDNVKTDLSLQNVRRLIQITKSIDLNKIQSHAYCSTITSAICTTALIRTYQDPVSGESALIPTLGIGEYSGLVNFYKQLTSNNPIVKENPSIVVLNGSAKTGLANTTGSYLSEQGFNVLLKTDALRTYTSTLVIDLTKGKKPNSLSYLLKKYKATSTTNLNSAESMEASGYTSDFVIVLGSN